MKNFSFKLDFLQTTLAFCLVLFAFAGFAAAQTAESSPAPKTFEISDDGVPVLIKNLPDWEKAQSRAVLAASLPELQKATGERPILSTIDFAGGTEAVTANYDNARLVIVEFHTPQMAIDMDAKIQSRLAELNFPLTNTAYRKEGNYAVFVFDASDEQTANTLLQSVAYAKQVQWLGGNPYPGIEAARKEREYIAITGGVFVAVLQSAGIAVVLALAFGGLLGAAVFYVRRKQQAAQDAYSDAGGMVRLNLDNMTPQIEAGRLIENK